MGGPRCKIFSHDPMFGTYFHTRKVKNWGQGEPWPPWPPGSATARLFLCIIRCMHSQCILVNFCCYIEYVHHVYYQQHVYYLHALLLGSLLLSYFFIMPILAIWRAIVGYHMPHPSSSSKKIL